MSSGARARVTSLAISPIRGFGLSQLDRAFLDPSGVSTNRRFFLVDDDGRRYTATRGGELFQLGAEWDDEANRLEVTFPSGQTISAVVRLGDPVVTPFFGGRPVSGRFALGPWSEAISEHVGRALRLVRIDTPGTAFPPGREVSLVSRRSLAALTREAKVDSVDGRRFRMLLEIDGCRPHEEDEWIGRAVRLGGAVVEIGGAVDRCAATTRNPETGRPDLDTLRAIKAYRGARDGKYLDFGVFARVIEPGEVRVGDPVEPGVPASAA
jgi:uncharacterized protein YcbX